MNDIFLMPQDGATGEQGPAGPTGATGATGPAGPNEVTASTSSTLVGILQADGTNVGTVTIGTGLSYSSGTLSASGGGSIGGSTGSTDNAILRADGNGGATLQGSGVTISDNSEVLIVSGAVSAVPLRVRATAGQTANLTDWQNSGGTWLLAVGADGQGLIGNGGLSVEPYLRALGIRFQDPSQTNYMYVGASLTPGEFGTPSINLSSSNPLNWTAGTNARAAADVSVRRRSAGILELRDQLYLRNSTEPATPTGGGVIYCESGALKYKGTSGTVTTLGPA